jgi:hypothetical protein
MALFFSFFFSFPLSLSLFWRDFLLGDDPNEEVVRRAEAVLGADA